jgi:cellulose synthase operon protein C
MTRGRASLLVLGSLTMAGVALAQLTAPAPVEYPTPPAAGPAFPTASPVAPAVSPAPQVAIQATPSTPTGNPAVALLVRQGQHWLTEGRPELAIQSAERALSAEPNNIDALLLAARASVARNDRTAARAYIDRLRSAGATPEQQARGEAILREATVDPAALAAARQLAREGHLDEAAARYQSLFGPGEPPPAYAREYYQVLASAQSTRALGQRGLARLAAEPQADSSTLLAYAESLTYSAATRADGIARLAALAGRPDVGAQAQAAWKQALGFYGQDPAVLPLMDAYLRRFPGDAEIMREEQAVRTTQPPPPSPAELESQAAYAALNSGSLAASEKQFTEILATNPTNADALAGLGIVRLRQNRPADARDLLQRAITAAPDRATQWKRALDAANYALDLANARALLRRGDVADADTVLHEAANLNVDDKTDAESMLGDVALRRGNAVEAEQDFRAALAQRPGFAPAISGLNQALRAEGRPGEVVPQPRGYPPSYAPAVGGGTVSTGAAARWRAEAAATSDPTVQVALLTNAMNAAPNDPWVRLDLARALRRLGRGAEGRAIMEELVARQSTPDTLYAAALLAQEDGRTADAEALMARIPVTRLTPDMARLQTRLRVQQEVASAAALLPTAPFVARQRLLALAARPDPTGGTAADVIRALGDAGDRVGAEQAAQTALIVNPEPAARIAIAGALLGAGLDAAANAMIAQLDTSRLTAAQRQDLASLSVEADIRASDKLNESGDQAAAFERLRPALVSEPNNPDVQLALARLYQGANRQTEAMHIAEAVLTRDPHNTEARRIATDAAIAAGNRRRAETLANEGAAISPGDSRATLLQAQVARAYGNYSQARSLLSEAAAQRQAELGMTPQATSVAGQTTLQNPFGSSGDGAPASADPVGPTILQNPFSPPGGGGPTAGAALPTDPVARQIAQEQAALWADTATRASGGVTIRVRSGTPGLDQLTDVSAPLEASFVPDDLAGRIGARVTPVVLDNGSLSGSANILRFGSNAGEGTMAVPSTMTATGVGLDVFYQHGSLVTADVGASPLGFPVSTVVGGIEIAPKLTDQITLRLRGERRMVTDSLLSYAGERDPVTGTTWGGVTRNGGHGQLEISLGVGGYAYAGGGYNVLTGQNVAQNNEVESGAGFGVPLYKQGDSTLLTGLDLIYFSYENNQRGFTLGQGGYFSPQNFFAINVPLDFRSTWGGLKYHLRGILGYDTFHEIGSPLYPINPALQAAADAAAAVNPDIPTTNQAQNKSGVVGGVRVDLSYPLTDELSIAGGFAFDQAPQWEQGSVYVRLDGQF